MKLLVSLAMIAVAPVAFAQNMPPMPTPPTPPTPVAGKNTEIIRSVVRTCTIKNGKQVCSEKRDGTPPKTGAIEVLDQFGAALKAGRTDEAAGLLDDNATIFEGGAAESKSEYTSRHIHADAKYLADTRPAGERQRRAVVMNGLASVTTIEKLIRGGDVMESTETATLMERNGVWKITHIHWSSRKAKTAD